MNEGFSHRGHPAFRRFLGRQPMSDEGHKMLKDVVSLGCMCSSSFASPILFEFHNIWFIDVFVFIFSSAAFMLQNQEEIKTYGPFTLVAVTFFGLAAYSSARTPLKELIPWLPTALCLFILLTVYFFPKLRQSLRGDNGTQIAMEEGRAFGYHRTPVEPGSIQSEEDIRSRNQSLDVARWLEYDTAHAGGIGQPASRQFGALSVRESDIDLEDRQSVARIVAQRMISPTRPGYNISSLPQTATGNGFPSQRFATTGSCSQPRDYRPRSPAESVVVEVPSSIAEESERPLLK